MEQAPSSDPGPSQEVVELRRQVELLQRAADSQRDRLDLQQQAIRRLAEPLPDAREVEASCLDRYPGEEWGRLPATEQDRIRLEMAGNLTAAFRVRQERKDGLLPPAVVT